MFGPTIGNKLRLADTNLATYGEEVKFRGGKVIRDGMGQSLRICAEGAMDTVIDAAAGQDTAHKRGPQPYAMAELRHGRGVDAIVAFLEREGGLQLAPRAA